MTFRTANLLFIFIPLILLSTSRMTSAQVPVFDNGIGLENVNEGINSDRDPAGFNFLAADDFRLSESAQISELRWSGAYGLNNSPPDIEDFIINIYADADGPTGEPVASFPVGNDVNRTPTDVVVVRFDIFQYAAQIDFTAEAGETYWLHIDGNSFADANDDFFWGAMNGGGNGHVSSDLGMTWAPSAPPNPVFEADFQLFAVPEPSSLCLALVVGGLCLIGMRRK